MISHLRRPAVLLSVLVGTAVLVAAVIVGTGRVNVDRPTSTKTITIGYSAWPGWFPWSIAAEKGLFAANGVNVEMRYFASYTESLTALVDGTIDANSQTLNDTLMSVSRGSRQTIVLVNDNSTGNDQIICGGDINSVADLERKSIAVEHGTVDHFLLLLALGQAGLAERDITVKAMPTDVAAARFAAGEVDCAAVFAPFTTVALTRPGSFAVATSAEFPGAIPDHLVFRSEVVEDRPTDVQAVVNTWFATLRWIKANDAEAVRIMAAKAGVTEAVYREYDSGTSIFTHEQNLDAFLIGTSSHHINAQAIAIADFMVETGLVDIRPSLDALFDPRFVDGVPAGIQ